MLWPERASIVPPSEVKALLRQCSRPAPDSAAVEGYWRPTQVQIGELESKLSAVLRDALPANSPRDAFIRSHLSRYYREYGGIILGGRRIIYVNGFDESTVVPWDTARRADSVEWRRDGVMVCDGGRGYFGVEYDPETREFSNLQFNGYA